MKCKECGAKTHGDETDKWTYLVIEGMCMRSAVNSCQRSKNFFTSVVKDGVWQKDKDGHLMWEKIPNKCYVPGTKIKRKPRFCPNHVCYICYTKGCPYLGQTTAGKAEMKFMNMEYTKGE